LIVAVNSSNAYIPGGARTAQFYLSLFNRKEIDKQGKILTPGYIITKETAGTHKQSFQNTDQEPLLKTLVPPRSEKEVAHFTIRFCPP